MAGSRELELLMFNFKNNLRVLSLGQYLYDELLDFIAEMCSKKLEKLEINSDQITDRSLVTVLRKMSELKYLDISGCPNITGEALCSVTEFGCTQLRRFICGFAYGSYEAQKVKEKLKEFVPTCQLEINTKKNFKV